MEGGGPREEADWASRLAEPVPTALQPRLGLDPLSAGEYIASSSRPSTKRHDMFTPGGHLYVDALFAATGLLASGSTTAVGASAGSAKANPALRRMRLCEITEDPTEGTVCRRAREESTRASLASQRSGIQRNTSSLSADRLKDHPPFAIHPPAMEHFHRMVTIHSVSLEKRVDSSESNAQTPWHSGTGAHACSHQRSVVLCMDVNVVDAEVAGDMRESTEDADGGWSGRKRRTETLS